MMTIKVMKKEYFVYLVKVVVVTSVPEEARGKAAFTFEVEGSTLAPALYPGR